MFTKCLHPVVKMTSHGLCSGNRVLARKAYNVFLIMQFLCELIIQKLKSNNASVAAERSCWSEGLEL